MRKLEFLVPMTAFLSSFVISVSYLLFFVEFTNMSKGLLA